MDDEMQVKPKYADVTWDNVTIALGVVQKRHGGFVRVVMQAGVGKAGTRSIWWLAFRTRRLNDGPDAATARVGGYYPSKGWRTAPQFVFNLVRALEDRLQQIEDQAAQSAMF